MLAKSLRYLVLIALISTLFPAIKSLAVIYETDDRHEAWDYAHLPEVKDAISSVALVTNRAALSPLEPGVLKLETMTYEEYEKSIEEPLCKEERFREEPQVFRRAGTGFLISPDLMITAGHVIDNQENCDRTAFIFDFSVNANHPDLSRVAESNVVNCDKLLFSQVTEVPEPDKKMDLAIVKLSRPVFERKTLKLQNGDPLNATSNLWMLGHPMGLPLKISDKATVYDLSHRNFFRSKIETYKGNSGGPVMQKGQNTVEGILIEGEATDITLRGEWPSGCWYSKVYCEDPNFPGCDDSNMTGAAIIRSSAIREILNQVVPGWELPVLD